MDLPYRNDRVTCFNQHILIKLHCNDQSKKGATFYTYLHELAHALQRADCTTYRSVMKGKSMDLEAQLITCYPYFRTALDKYKQKLQVNMDVGYF